MPMKKVDIKYNPALIKIGLNVAYYRKLRGFTQEKLADALDVPTKKLFGFRDEDD